MKKKIISFFLILALATALTAPAYAETLSGGTDWSVTFNEAGKIDSNLPAFGEEISGLQPGDDISFMITVNNKHKDTVDWYMMNTILKSLEDATTASGGAYTYILTYQTSAGQVQELYNSDTVGGELSGSSVPEGLHEVDSSLKDYFFLESMPSKGTGVVTLKVALDGESQGNRYWNTEAGLRMRFAAELTPTKTVVKTGDSTDKMPYIVGLGASGLLILLLAINGTRQRKRNGGARA